MSINRPLTLRCEKFMDNCRLTQPLPGPYVRKPTPVEKCDVQQYSRHRTDTIGCPPPSKAKPPPGTMSGSTVGPRSLDWVEQAISWGRVTLPPAQCLYLCGLGGPICSRSAKVTSNVTSCADDLGAFRKIIDCLADFLRRLVSPSGPVHQLTFHDPEAESNLSSVDCGATIAPF
ncbi:hypothetical protein PIB30_048238 [Stylosanthes scabra]|uniref:Uncharacterized protein n=1 Tax=Stylosanthes scabra TaxID=79078 RepID=A0ABU6WIP1_9FABA|nr:hypothetical protein [Stylosanthes scabra]